MRATTTSAFAGIMFADGRVMRGGEGVKRKTRRIDAFHRALGSGSVSTYIEAESQLTNV